MPTSFAAIGPMALPVVGGAPAYLYQGNSGDLGGTSPITWATADLGAAAADRFLVVGIEGDGTSSATLGTTITVDGTVTLNRDAFYNQAGANRPLAFYSGLVPTGGGTSHSIVATTVNNTAGIIHIWTMTGAAYAFRQTANNSAPSIATPISVVAGQFMFGLATRGGASPVTWTTSTQNSFADHPDISYGGFSGSDWTIAATNASFNAQTDVGFDWLVATYS